jgi:hypothetical protein
METQPFLKWTLGLGLAFCCFACKEVPETSGKRVTVNPNGSAPLAILMQSMTQHMKQVKMQLQSPELPTPNDDFAQIIHLESTPGLVPDTASFNLLAKDWLDKLDVLHQSSLGEAREKAYLETVEGCLSCHQSHCQGPIPMIQELKKLP